METIEKRLGYRFKNAALLEEALTHGSFTPATGGAAAAKSDRLEFLGDAVVNLYLAERMFRTFPDEPPGGLTVRRARVARNASLARVASRLGLGEEIRLSPGEVRHGGRQRVSILAGSFEALIGAVYLDGGREPTLEILERFLGSELARSGADEEAEDYKSRLQERLQGRHGVGPVYRIIDTTGPPHQRHFVVEVLLNGERLAVGEGRSRKEAEKNAARLALSAEPTREGT